MVISYTLGNTCWFLFPPKEETTKSLLPHCLSSHGEDPDTGGGECSAQRHWRSIKGTFKSWNPMSVIVNLKINCCNTNNLGFHGLFWKVHLHGQCMKIGFFQVLIFFQSQDKQSPWFENLPHCCMIYVSVFKLMDLYLSYLMKINFYEL